MFNFFKGLKSAVSGKAVANDQVLFATDKGQLFVDIGDTRYAVKDPSSGQRLSYANKVITLKDADGNTLSEITIDPTLSIELAVNLETGHLEWQ